MPDFERKFRKGVVLLISAHLVLAFFTLYLLESLVPKVHLPIEKRFQLRSDLDSIAISLSQIQSMNVDEWQISWTLLIHKTKIDFQKAGLEFSSLTSLVQIPADEIVRNKAALANAQNYVLETARLFDKEWEKSFKNYRNSILGGGWTIALISIAGLLCLVYFNAMIQRTMILPLVELIKCMNEWKEGNSLRRCKSPLAGQDVHRMMDILNETMDAKQFPSRKISHDE